MPGSRLYGRLALAIEGRDRLSERDLGNRFNGVPLVVLGELHVERDDAWRLGINSSNDSGAVFAVLKYVMRHAPGREPVELSL